MSFAGRPERSIHATARTNEVLAKVLLHNLTCIVHAVTEHGIANDVIGTLSTAVVTKEAA